VMDFDTVLVLVVLAFMVLMSMALNPEGDL